MWTPACQAHDVEADDLIGVQLDGREYAIVRTVDDRYLATDGYCTHERELLCDGLVIDGEIECPRHLGRFDAATGKARGAPALIDLRTYPTRVVDGVVYLDRS